MQAAARIVDDVLPEAEEQGDDQDDKGDDQGKEDRQQDLERAAAPVGSGVITSHNALL
jgi:vacuolar-type H+-ATPase subunit H